MNRLFLAIASPIMYKISKNMGSASLISEKDTENESFETAVTSYYFVY